MSQHPLHQFHYCPQCGSNKFVINDEKSKRCDNCGFVYYFNPSASVAAFIRDNQNNLLLVKRAKEPAQGTLDLPGGFTDMYESAEEAVVREIKEETGLTISSSKYLFSIPNIYPYCGFNVHTVDLFYECRVNSAFDKAMANDDAAEIVILQPNQLDSSRFGLHSISQAVEKYKSMFINNEAE